MQSFGIPKSLESLIQSQNQEKQDWPGLAKSILTLSDFYLKQPEAMTPLDFKQGLLAYLHYFFPLNYARASAMWAEAGPLIENVNHVIDFGAGTGAASLALLPYLKKPIKFSLVDRNLEAVRFAQSAIAKTSKLPHNIEILSQWSAKPSSASLVLFSYSLTELSHIPSWALAASRLAILEPSTREDGRKLLDLRNRLIRESFHILAPCPHQGDCPLRKDSATDWCHERIRFQPTSWWEEWKDRLPMRNETITFSFLLASKETETKNNLSGAKPIRVVGDPLPEKGKSRQLICADEHRRFLAWFTNRMKIPLGTLDRGDHLEFLFPPVEKANEWRISEGDQLKILKRPGQVNSD